MVTLSMTWSVTPLTSSKKPRRVNRYSGMAFASSGGGNENPYIGAKITEGQGNLPKVVLTSSHGSEVELYLFGGCVTSWKVGGKDLLFVRPDAVFNGQKPISGGIPHCFPQFGPGEMQQHGFARNMNWSIAESENVEGNPTITLELKDGPYSHSMWDYSFQMLYKVILDKRTLSTELKVTNTDQKPFSFTTALHTYFSASVTGAAVRGLKGCKTLNKDPDPKNPVEGKEESHVWIGRLTRDILSQAFDILRAGMTAEQDASITNMDTVTFPGFVDCVYLDAPNELHLDNGLGNTISIKNTNWSDTVLWNPYLTMEASYKTFVCVENAKIGKVQLAAKQSWTAVQHLSVA